MRDELGIALIALSLFSLAMCMLLLRSLNIQLGIQPPPTGDPQQHGVVGCIAIIVLLAVAVAIVANQ